MMNKRIINIVSTLLLAATSTFAQINKTNIVEHFTNTSCSICAGNNQSYYNIINNFSNTLHISFHPSSPYTSDVFSQQNKKENDDRTTFYGVYGGTPRLVVNGNVIQNGNLNSVLSNASSDKSNFELKLYLTQETKDLFNVKVVIKKVANDTMTSAVLFLGIIEDTINQTTNNGEKVHYNVFRKSITSTLGNTIQLPVNIGDSIETSFNFNALSIWNRNRIHGIGILQRSNKSVINSAKSMNKISFTAEINGISTENKVSLLYPNPINQNIVFSKEDIVEMNIYHLSGQLIRKFEYIKKNEAISLMDIEPGVYFSVYKTEQSTYFQKLVLQ